MYQDNILPVFYDYMNARTSLVTPSTLHIANSEVAWFFKRSLIQKILARYKIKIPKTWSTSYFKYVLFCIGFISVFETDVFGVIPQICTPNGRNVFFEPSTVNVTNPLIENGTLQTLEIGKNCELIKMQPDFGGVMDIVEYYGNMLALCVSTAEINLHNSKLSYIFAAKNKSAAESFKKLYDQVSSGEPAAFIDKNLLDDNGNINVQYFTQSVGQNFITPQILDAMRTIENMFDTEVGIPNANVSKRERLTDDEVNVNNSETFCRATLWLESMKEGFEKVRDMFGISESELNIEFAILNGPKGPKNAAERDEIIDTYIDGGDDE